MIRATILTALLLLPTAATATTCSQLNSECDAKLLLNPIVGPKTDAESNAKTLLNIITNPAIQSNTKLLLNVILIPGTPAGGIVPASPLTHFR